MRNNSLIHDLEDGRRTYISEEIKWKQIKLDLQNLPCQKFCLDYSNDEKFVGLFFIRICGIFREFLYSDKNLENNYQFNILSKVINTLNSLGFPTEEWKIKNRLRNAIALKCPGRLTKDLKAIINNFEVTVGDNVPKIVFVQISDFCRKNNIRLDQQDIVNNITPGGIDNFGQLLHIAHTSLFKIRPYKDIDAVIENAKIFVKCFPEVLDFFQDKTVISDPRKLPDIGHLFDYYMGYLRKLVGSGPATKVVISNGKLKWN